MQKYNHISFHNSDFSFVHICLDVLCRGGRARSFSVSASLLAHDGEATF